MNALGGSVAQSSSSVIIFVIRNRNLYFYFYSGCAKLTRKQKLCLASLFAVWLMNLLWTRTTKQLLITFSFSQVKFYLYLFCLLATNERTNERTSGGKKSSPKKIPRWASDNLRGRIVMTGIFNHRSIRFLAYQNSNRISAEWKHQSNPDQPPAPNDRLLYN